MAGQNKLPGGTLRILSTQGSMIRVVGEGFWSEAIVHAYFAELRKFVQERRLDHKKIRIFLDICGAPAQSANIVDQILAGLNEMLAPDDKLAVVVKTVISKLQSERLGKQVGTHRVFTSVADAEAWLND